MQSDGQNDGAYACFTLLSCQCSRATNISGHNLLFSEFEWFSKKERCNSSRNLNGSQRKSDAKTTLLPVFTRRDWPQNWTLEELARLEDMWKEGKTIAAIHASGFQNRSLATVRDLLRIVFSRNTGKETRLSLNQSRITEHDKKEILTLHDQGETVQAMSRQLEWSVSSIYRLFKTLDIRPNSTKTRQRRRRFTADELSILSSWMDREVYSQEIADNFPDRTTGSIGRRLYVERQKVGSTIRPRRM